MAGDQEKESDDARGVAFAIEGTAAPEIPVSLGQLAVISPRPYPAVSGIPTIRQTERQPRWAVARQACARSLVLGGALFAALLPAVRPVAAVVAAHFVMAVIPGIGGFWYNNQNYSPQPSAYAGPGDTVTGALAWWGLRAYSAATRGNPAVNVCIPADVACADLSTNASTGALTISTIGGSSCSVVTCTVKTIYDQTGALSCGGAACDLTNATEVGRPVLTVSCVSSLPCLTFSGAQKLTKAATTFTQSQPWTLSAVSRQTGNTGSDTVILASVTGIFFTAISQTQLFAGTGVTLAGALNTWYAIQGIGNGSSSVLYRNGSSNSVSAGTNGWSSASTIVIGDDGGDFLDGNITEVGMWGVGFAGSDNIAMDSNQRAYWGF